MAVSQRLRRLVSFLEKLLAALSLLGSAVLSYRAGRNAVSSEQKDEAIKQQLIAKEVDDEIRASHSNPTIRSSLRDKWSKS